MNKIETAMWNKAVTFSLFFLSSWRGKHCEFHFPVCEQLVGTVSSSCGYLRRLIRNLMKGFISQVTFISSLLGAAKFQITVSLTNETETKYYEIKKKRDSAAAILLHLDHRGFQL